MSEQPQVTIDLPQERWEFDSNSRVALLRGEFDALRPLIIVKSMETAAGRTIEDVADAIYATFEGEATDPKLVDRQVRDNGRSLVQTMTGIVSVTDAQVPVVEITACFLFPMADSPNHFAYWMTLVTDVEHAPELTQEFGKAVSSLQFHS